MSLGLFLVRESDTCNRCLLKSPKRLEKMEWSLNLLMKESFRYYIKYYTVKNLEIYCEITCFSVKQNIRLYNKLFFHIFLVHFL